MHMGVLISYVWNVGTPYLIIIVVNHLVSFSVVFQGTYVSSGFSIRIGVGGNTSGVGGEGIPRAKGMTLGWVHRNVSHLGDSYNLDLLKCISAF